MKKPAGVPIASLRCARTWLLVQGITLIVLLCLPASAHAQVNRGFQLNRYEPTAAGEWSILVDHPWYSSRRYVAAGITFGYAHNPLVAGTRDSGQSLSTVTPVIEHQLISHLDVAGSFLDRVLLTLSLPITLMERGSAAAHQPGAAGPERGRRPALIAPARDAAAGQLSPLWQARRSAVASRARPR